MAASRRSISLGILAEDESDVAVVRAVLPKIAPRKFFGIKTFLGRGCGKLRAKCQSWATVLANRGCRVLILIHDSDGADVAKLRKQIEDVLLPSPINPHVIVIAVEEIEAWLLTDPNALKAVFHLKKAFKCPANPEKTRNPKEHLEDLIWRVSEKRKEYVNTLHNGRIAARASLSALRRCQAFCELQSFWAAL